MNNSEIGLNIKKGRKRVNMTQQVLADKIGKTESTIRKYENGSIEIPMSVLELIADALDLHILDLLDDRRAFEKYEEYSNSFVTYYKSLGYAIELDDHLNNIVITHNGYSYIAPADLFLKLESDLRIDAEYSIDAVIEKYSNTKFKA